MVLKFPSSLYSVFSERVNLTDFDQLVEQHDCMRSVKINAKVKPRTNRIFKKM